MVAAHETSPSERQPVCTQHRTTALARSVIVVCLLPVLVYLCLQTDHARLKGMPMESWRLLPLIMAAAACALLGKRILNSVAGVFIGGVGGAFGTLDQFAGPYGALVGLVTGAIAVAIPIFEKPRSNVTAIGAASTDKEDAVRDEL